MIDPITQYIITEAVNARSLPRSLLSFLLSGQFRKSNLSNELFDKPTQKFSWPMVVSDLDKYNIQAKKEQDEYLTKSQLKYFNDMIKKNQLFFIAIDSGGNLHAYSFKDKYVYGYWHETRKFDYSLEHYKRWIKKAGTI